MSRYFACVFRDKIISRIVTDDNPSQELLEALRRQGAPNADGVFVPYDFLREVPGPEVPTPPNPQIGWLYDRSTDSFNPDPNPPVRPPPQELVVEEHGAQLALYQTFLEQVAARLGIPPPSDVVTDPPPPPSDDGSVNPPKP